MKYLLILIIISLSVSFITDEYAFEKLQKFIRKYHKNYNSVEEFLNRFNAFKNNLIILESGKLQNIPSSHHEIGLTKFSDLTEEEFKKNYLGLKLPSSNPIHNLSKSNTKLTLEKSSNIPESFDWVNEKGVLLSPKNQYSCGSCWAFSVVGHLEAQYFLKYGFHKIFSEQQLVDCDSYDAGCNGGEFLTAYKWTKKMAVYN